MSFPKKLLFAAVVFVVLVAGNYYVENGFAGFGIPDLWIRIILLTGISITAAVSLNLINGLTGQFSLGHAGFMAVGGYTAAYVTRYYGEPIAAALGADLSAVWAGQIALFLGLVAGAVTAALAGLVVGIPSLRLKGDYLAIVTLGFGEIIRVVILNTPAVGGALGFTNVPPLANFFSIYAVVVITIVIVRNITQSTFGRAMAAIREDEIAAEAMGIDTTRYKVTSFVISSALAGVAGGLFGHMFGNLLTPQAFNFIKPIEFIIMIVLGGVGSITGAVFGAVVLTVLPEWLRDVDQFYPGLRMVIYALLLILMMIFRPQGLLGRREFGLHWFRRPSKTPIPVALSDSPGSTPARPVSDTHSSGGKSDE